MVHVTEIESTLVVPIFEATPSYRGMLALSHFEQLSGVFHTSTVYLYRNNNEASDFFSIDVMKAALAKTLALFYPLAGRLVTTGTDGRRAIDCNAQGALFVVARSSCTSHDIDFQPGDPQLRNHFVPKAAPSLMATNQVTYLKCGGVVLGTTTNHVLMDGRSSALFVQTWSSIARGELNNIVAPCINFSLIHARTPPIVTFHYPDYEVRQSKNALAITHDSSHSHSDIVTTKLKLSNEQISFLKSRCSEGSPNNKRVSTFCAISALFWKCYCIAQQLPPGTQTRFHFAVDVRKRLQPPLPENYLGNAIIRTSTSAEVTKVTSNPIYVASDAVKAAIDGFTDEYVRSFIDYMEINQEKKLSLILDLPKSDLRISDLTAMSLNEIDFGWGAPELVTWPEVPGTNIIYVMNEPNNVGVAACVILDPDIMHKFEKVFYEELTMPSEI